VILSSIGGSVASTSDLKSASTPVVFDTAPATPFGVGAAAAGGAERQDGEWEEVVSVREVDAGAVNQVSYRRRGSALQMRSHPGLSCSGSVSECV